MTQQTGGQAFPQPFYDEKGHVIDGFAGMTLRQYAAIKLKVPNSGVDWLDEMINQSLKNDFASKAMQVLLPDQEYTVQDDAEFAYEMADAMLKAREQCEAAHGIKEQS